MPRKRKFDCSVHEAGESSRSRKSRRVPNSMNVVSAATLSPTTYFDEGDCEYVCEYCSAFFWFAERIQRASRHARPRYSQCCKGGAVRLPYPLYPPPAMKSLFEDVSFMENIRAYNNMFSITSFGARIDDAVNDGRGPYVFKVSGQDAVYWVEGTIIGVDSNREFCYLACRICGKKVEEVAGKKWCLHCRAFTFTNIFRYNVEIVVADESDTAKMTLWNRATQKLLGEPAEDVISLYGDTARVMPDDIAEKILGREGLFEVVICSQRSYDDGFNVSRLTVDDEIKDAYIMRNFPAAYEPSSEDESFQATLDYVEEKDRASHN